VSFGVINFEVFQIHGSSFLGVDDSGWGWGVFRLTTTKIRPQKREVKFFRENFGCLRLFEGDFSEREGDFCFCEDDVVFEGAGERRHTPFSAFSVFRRFFEHVATKMMKRK